MLKLLIFIGMGSFLGGLARYGLGKFNVSGCFLIGLFYGLFDRYDVGGVHWRMFLTVGFCGGFTTFSTFVHENYVNISQGRFFETVLYATLSFAIGLVMVYVGHRVVSSC